MSKLMDLTGRRFGRLVVTSHAGRLSANSYANSWHCQCDCGNTTVVLGKSLRSGHTQSCKCLAVEAHTAAGARSATHGMARKGARSPVYSIWVSMIARCTNPKSKDYPRYGGAGISVCQRWLASFQDFLADMGDRPSPKHSIDRFPNNAGNYEPGNCRWATDREQRTNRKNSLHVTFRGEVMPLVDACQQANANYDSVRRSLRKRGEFAGMRLTSLPVIAAAGSAT